jgi:hypothetical protein
LAIWRHRSTITSKESSEMPRIFLPNVTPRAFGPISRFVAVGLLLFVCAGCSLQKKVPAADLEVERQRRQLLQSKQQNLLKEIRRQIAVQHELEEKLAAEKLQRRKLHVQQRELKKALEAESAAQAELREQVAAESRQRQTLEQQQAQFERELAQQTAIRDALYDDVSELEMQLAEEDLKREEWAQWQEQIERDLAQQSAAREALVDDVSERDEQIAADEPEREEWALLVEERDAKRQSVAREILDYSDANLYLLLLEKKAYIARLTEQIEKVTSEVVRAKAKLRSLESKAEAASNLAEAEIAVESLRARGEAWKSDPSVLKAEQLTRASAREFEEGNYGGALYLTSQAKSLIENAWARSNDQETSSAVKGEVPFLLPLNLQLLTQSDVRKGPGSQFEVMYSWEYGIALVGHAFKGQWVRVTRDDGLGGWVFYKSVGSN